MGARMFEDLPLVTDEEEMRRVHRTEGLYFVVRGGKAHHTMTCGGIDQVESRALIANPRWRVADYGEIQTLKIPWCFWCCE
jgi:hypothetical protein